MNRSRSYTAAAILMVLFSLVSLAFELPNLMRGAVDAADAPPFVITVVNFVSAVLGFVAAFGIWRVEKWGVVLAIVLMTLAILTGLPGLIFAPMLPLRIAAGVGIVWSALIIVLLLRPTPQPSAA